MKNENRALAFAPLIMPFAFTGYASFAGISGFDMREGLLTFFLLFLGTIVAGLPVAAVQLVQQTGTKKVGGVHGVG